VKKNISELLLINIGFISKPYGFNGELVFAIQDGEAEEYKKIKFIFIELEGKPVPFFVGGIRMQRSDIIAQLEDVNTEAEAKNLPGKRFLLKSPM
jgi:ribosomal 30S subunit maturation factor RimM